MRGIPCLAVLILGLCGTSHAWADANDTPAGASGPLLQGDFWSGSISTENDVDWYVLYSGASTELGVHLNSQGPDDCFGQVIELTDGDGRYLSHYSHINSSETGHILYTVGIGTFYIKVSPYNVAPCIGSNAKYVLWVTASPGLLTAPPYIPPPAPPSTPTTPNPSVIRAAKDCEHARGRVAGLTRKLRRARGINYRNAIRRDIRRARAEVGRRC